MRPNLVHTQKSLIPFDTGQGHRYNNCHFKQVYYPSKDRSWGGGLEGAWTETKSPMTKVSNSERGGVRPPRPP